MTNVKRPTISSVGKAVEEPETFPSREYWSGVPFPSPGYLLNLWTEPTSPALAGRFFTTEPPGKPTMEYDAAIFKKEKVTDTHMTWDEP